MLKLHAFASEIKVILQFFFFSFLNQDLIKIKFDNGYEAKFCHLSSRSVEKGEFILKGQEIGKSGGDKSDSASKRGNSEDAHLHFELKKDGSFVDPSKHINKNYCTKA